jgi:predicted RNA-binding protein YlxR (DUF448 family)
VRTCVGCRERTSASDLVRVVVRDGALVPDLAHRLPGRGAHLHPSSRCLDLAVRRRAFTRALRLTEVPQDALVRLAVERAERETGSTGP